MPLTNNVIIKLNEITTIIEDKNNLKDSEIDEVKKIFQMIIEDGERYDLDDKNGTSKTIVQGVTKEQKGNLELLFQSDNIVEYKGKVILPV